MTETLSGEQNKAEILTHMLHGQPDVVYLMSGGVAPGVHMDYRSTSMLDPDMADGYTFGYLGGALRVHATAELHRYFPHATIITSSVVNGISHAKVQERELRALWEKWGVEPPVHVLREEKSSSTRGELAALVRMIRENDWKGSIVAVTNDYHVPRALTTLEHLPELIIPDDPSFADVWSQFQSQNDVQLNIQSAESVLKVVNPKFEAMLQKAFLQDPWKSSLATREKKEQEGREAIVAKTYDPQKAREKTE